MLCKRKGLLLEHEWLRLHQSAIQIEGHDLLLNAPVLPTLAWEDEGKQLL